MKRFRTKEITASYNYPSQKTLQDLYQCDHCEYDTPYLSNMIDHLKSDCINKSALGKRHNRTRLDHRPEHRVLNFIEPDTVRTGCSKTIRLSSHIVDTRCLRKGCWR